MTKPRISTTRELFGILGSHPERSALQAKWNHLFTEKGIDAFMDKYPTTEENLPERLSEMFHFDRRGYIVAPSLQEAIIPLLDFSENEKVDTVWNDGGVMKGFCIEEGSSSKQSVMEKRFELWT